MIGGTMLLCAVGAMILIATWSLKRDEDPDVQPRDGLLALRQGRGPSKRRAPRHAPRQRRAAPRRNVTPHAPRAVQFDPDEMAEIEAEAQATLPAFIRNAREEY